jgi:hypothetical protein
MAMQDLKITEGVRAPKPFRDDMVEFHHVRIGEVQSTGRCAALLQS